MELVKNTQISFDESLLKALDRVAVLSRKARSSIVREAVKAWPKQREIQDFEEQWIQKLAEYPDDLQDSETWMRAEQWGDV